MGYSLLSPKTLATLKPVKDLPGYGEVASDLQTSLLQTRDWMYNFFAGLFDKSLGDTIKPTAFPLPTRPTGFVRGSNPVDGSQREILQKSLQFYDFKRVGISGNTFGLFNDNIADGALHGRTLVTFNALSGLAAFYRDVDIDAIKDGTMTSDLFEAGGFSLPAGERVDTARLANRAVTQIKLLADPFGSGSAMTKRATQSRAVGGVQLPACTLSQWLTGGFTITQHDSTFGTDQLVTKCLKPVTLDAPFSIDAEGKATMERITNVMQFTHSSLGVAAVPTYSALAWNRFPLANYQWLHNPLNDQKQEADLGSTPANPETFCLAYNAGNRISFIKDGNYLIFARFSGLSTDGFVGKMDTRLDGDWPAGQVKTFYSNSAYSASAGSYATAQCMFFCAIQVANTGVANDSKPFVRFDVYPNAAGTAGYWLPRTASERDPNFSSFVTIIKMF